MSDFRVDGRALEDKYGLNNPDQQDWSVMPVWQAPAANKQLVTLDRAGPAADVIRKVFRIFEARTMARHSEAVQVVQQQLLWDAPDIRLTNKDHLRLATYLFKYIAQPKATAVVAAVSQPCPGCHLIEVDAVLQAQPHKRPLLPLTWLLPQQIVRAVHMKIGINGSLQSGKVELMVSRFTNTSPFPPRGWQRGLFGVVIGALPFALEAPLGFLFDWAEGPEGGGFYAHRRQQQFDRRHPGSTDPLADWLTDLATDIPQWALEQGSVALESAQALLGPSFGVLVGIMSSWISLYVWLFTSILQTLQGGLIAEHGDNNNNNNNQHRAGPAAAYSPSVSSVEGVRTPQQAFSPGPAAARRPWTPSSN